MKPIMFDERDVRAGILRYTLNAEEVMGHIHHARLVRLLAENSKAQKDALNAMTGLHGAAYLKQSKVVDRLFAEHERLMDEAFPSTKVKQ